MDQTAHPHQAQGQLTNRVGLQWTIALAASAALLAPAYLSKQHYAARTVSARITGALVIWFVLAAVLRWIIRAMFSTPRGDRSWPHPSARAERWTVRYALAALIAAWALVIALAAVLWSVGVHVPHGVATLIVEGAFLATLVPLYRSGRLRLVDLGFRRAPAARSVGLAALGLIAYGLLSSVWAGAVHPPPIHSNFAGIRHESTLALIATGFAAAVAAPVVEEVFFRGFLYRSLRNRVAILPACLIVGVVFGAGHTQYPLLVRPELAVFGVISCLIYERTGSLLPGIAVHSFIDASGFETALTGQSWIVASLFAILALILLAPAAARGLPRADIGGGRDSAWAELSMPHDRPG